MTREEAIKNIIEENIRTARNFLTEAVDTDKSESVRALYVELAAKRIDLVLALMQKEEA